MNSEFHAALSSRLDKFRSVYSALVASKEKMSERVNSVIEYFGEEVGVKGEGDTTKLFSVLQQFRGALQQSKDTVMRRERSNRK
jgi:aspartyl aminopeptidase